MKWGSGIAWIWLPLLFRPVLPVPAPQGFSSMPVTPDKFYKRLEAKLFAWDAVRECNRFGASLPRFEDEAELSAIMEIVASEADQTAWIDLYNPGFYSHKRDLSPVWGSGATYENSTGILSAYTQFTFCFM